MSVENDGGSSIGPPPSSDEENGVDIEAQGGASSMGGNDSATGGASSSIGNGSATGGIELDSDLSEDEDLPQVDRFGFTGGKQFTGGELGLPIEILRKRELKWLDMIDDWEKWMTKKPKKVRERCRKGVPSSLRGRAWQFLCGSKKLVEQNKGKFEELDAMPGDTKWIDVIEKDLDRQFPFHEMFATKGGNGQQDLFRILKAYSIYNPRDGYCQGQAPVAAVLLMHMPAEEAFWCMVQICERYLTGYYSPGLEAVQIDGEVLFGLIKKVLPATHKHMKKHRIEPILYMTEWFMCIFARTLPWTSVLRVWDMFLCEGVKIMFRVALVLLKFTLGSSHQLADSPGLYETMEKLKHIPDSVVQEDFLAAEMLKVKVFEKDLEAEHSLSLARRKAIRERQLSSEKAAANARDIEVKKKTSKVKNPAKQWEKEKKRRDKERRLQNDTDSVISVPNSVDLAEEAEEGKGGERYVVINGVEVDGKEDKKKKKKDKKDKKKDKLTLDTTAARGRKFNEDLPSPDIEREYEIVDRLSSTSGSPTKSVKSRSIGFSDRDYTSEDTLDLQSSKKKKKDKKKKSKGKDDVVSIGEKTDDACSMVISPDGLTDTIDRKDKKKDKKKKKRRDKDKGSSGEDKFDDAISILTVQDEGADDGKGKKKDKKKDKKRKKSKDVEVEVDLPGMVRGNDDESIDRFAQADTESIKSYKKDKKKEKKDKKKKSKDVGNEVEGVKGNGVIPNDNASDGNLSSPANLSDYEVVERWKQPSESSKRGSEKRMGLIYSDDEIRNQWAGMADFGPIPEIPSFDVLRERRRSKERQDDERRQKLSPKSEPVTPIGGAPEAREAFGRGRMPHSLSNGMEPEEALSLQMSNGNGEASRSDKANHNKMRDYHSFDYGTTV